MHFNISCPEIKQYPWYQVCPDLLLFVLIKTTNHEKLKKCNSYILNCFFKMNIFSLFKTCIILIIYTIDNLRVCFDTKVVFILK